jgi:hypothetical protein
MIDAAYARMRSPSPFRMAIAYASLTPSGACDLDGRLPHGVTADLLVEARTQQAVVEREDVVADGRLQRSTLARAFAACCRACVRRTFCLGLDDIDGRQRSHREAGRCTRMQRSSSGAPETAKFSIGRDICAVPHHQAVTRSPTSHCREHNRRVEGPTLPTHTRRAGGRRYVSRASRTGSVTRHGSSSAGVPSVDARVSPRPMVDPL